MKDASKGLTFDANGSLPKASTTATNGGYAISNMPATTAPAASEQATNSSTTQGESEFC